MSMAEYGEASAQRQRALDYLKRQAGPLLMDALADPLTIEVMLNPDGTLWQERFGENMKVIGSMDWVKADVLIRLVASCLNKTVTWNSPLLNGEFPLDDSRFSAAVPPVVAKPAFAIRRKASRIFTLDEYVDSKVMTPHQRDVLCESIAQRKNILVVGGPSSGKTTLTNALLSQVVKQHPNLRIFVFEDTGEIQCFGENSVFFHTSETVDMSMLLENPGLRMRPDIICLGEVRNHAALDLMDAWNTGNDGGVATMHATSAERGLSRLRSLISRNKFAPRDAIEEVIGESVQRLVHIVKTPDGRRVKEILGINGYSIQKQQYDIDVLATDS